MWTTDPSQAVYKFCKGDAPFNTPVCTRCLTVFSQLQNLQHLIHGEAGSLLRAAQLPAADAEMSAAAKAMLNIIAHSIAITLDPNDFGQLCASRDAGRITEAKFEAEIIEMAANLLAITYNAAYVTAGIAAELSPVDYPHEIVATSAQRFRALADEITVIVGKGALTALMAG